MTWLSDEGVAHLRAVTELPDFAETRYRIVRELARGGMGVVYEADDLDLLRRVAIKVVSSELAGSDAVEMLRGEAETIARLEHPGIVPVHDVGALPDGRIWYAMKLVRGRRLDELAAEPHGLAELLRIFLRICEAVSFAHANSIVHCDLKPQNVMLGDFGEVLVMDWGIARHVGVESGSALVGGTPGYMAPEQLREGAGSIDAATDVYALGITLKELLTSTGQTVERPLAAIGAHAAAEVKRDRYPDASALAADVRAYLDGRPLVAYRENFFERAAKWLDRNRALLTVVVAYLVMRVIVFLWVR
ncbi:MAG: serine/threonine-protein kinase [Acidobacteriota bacterium]